MNPLRKPSALPIVAVALAVTATPGAAQEQDTVPPDSVRYEIEEIQVRVARPVATVGGAAAVTTDLDSLRAAPSPTLEDVLRRMPLIQIRENSRGEAQPTLRGMEARRLAILVDGVPITIGWDDRADLSVVPLTAARQVTMVRGLSSVLDGPNALGGAVKVGIASGPAPVSNPTPFRLSASVDHLGATATALELGTRLRADPGDLLIRVGGGYRQRSELPLPDDVVQPAGAEPGQRLNSDLEHANGFLVARYRAESGAWASLSAFGFRAEKGVPPELHISEPRLWRIPSTSRFVTALSGGTAWGETPWGEGDLEASIGIDLGDTEIDTYETFTYDSVTGGELGEDRTLSFRLVGDHTLGPGILRGALTLAETRHVEVLEPGGRSTFEQRLWSLGVEAEQPLPLREGSGSPARVSAGFSVDGSDTPETGGRPARDRIWAWGARAGGTVALAEGGLLLNGGVSRRVRFPALRELYSGALGKFVPNPQLAPEVLVVGELGATVSTGALEAQAVLFHQRLSDAIVRAAVGDDQFQRQNRDRITATGLELLANYEWKDVSLAGDVTLQDVDLQDPSAPEDQRRPEHKPWIAGGVGITAPLPWRSEVRVDLRHMGRQYCVNPDLERQQAVDPSTWLDLELGRSFALRSAAPGRHLEASLSMANLTDVTVLDQCGLPQPGRTLRFQIRVF